MAARKNPVVDSVLTSKEVSTSAYKLATGKKPPSAKDLLHQLPPGIARIERESTRRERRLDRRFGK